MPNAVNPAAKIVITGGGTGGHVFPALALGEAFREQGWEVLFAGSPTGFEAKHVPQAGFRFVPFLSAPVKNKSLFQMVKSIIRVSVTVLQAFVWLGREKPLAVLGVGGYVSVPVCIAAWLRRIPVYLQEQNASVGIANRFLGRFAKRVFLGFEGARKAFPTGRSVVSGNPLRSVFYTPAKPPNPHRVLIVGGSQGARAVNEGFLKILPRVLQLDPHLSIVHQTGPERLEETQKAYSQYPHLQVRVVAFLENIVEEYQAAALVLCRSGALTVSELVQIGRPAIFVPYPRKGQNDQTANAAMVARAGGGLVVEQGERFEERLWEAFQKMFQPTELPKARESLAQLRPSHNPTQMIVKNMVDSLQQPL